MRTGRGLDRFTNFTDAVVAIAITLMVLPLVDIVSGEVRQQTSVSHLLSENSAAIFSFALSFAVIANLWLSHQRIFEQVALYDSNVIISGYVWMLSIILLPFLTTLIAEFPNDRMAVGLYIGDLAVSSACLTFMVVIVSRTPQLRRADAEVDPIELWHAFVTTGIFVLALIVAFAVPMIGLWAILLLRLSGPATRLLVGRLGVLAKTGS